MKPLATEYLGIELPHPIIPGASPMADDFDSVLMLEDAGAAAIVMRSIFEEQIALEQMAAHRHFDVLVDAEATGFSAESDGFALGVDTYLRQLRTIRERTSLKVIGSLNGCTPGGWIDYARRMEQAGAHALELNLYALPSDATRSAQETESEQLSVVRAVTQAVRLPVAVKLSPFYSSLPHFVRSLEAAGARGVVMFNRLYQADIDPVELRAVRSLHLSTPDELLLRLRWLAIISPQTRLQLAASGGVHSTTDAVKAIMAGAHAVQMVSALLKDGAHRLQQIIDGLEVFVVHEEYDSLSAMRGNMNLSRAPDPSAYERSEYMQILQGWHKPLLG